MGWSSGEKCRAAQTEKGVPMTKHYVVEELAGTEHEAGPRKLHVLEARMVSGTWSRPHALVTKSGFRSAKTVVTFCA